MGSLPDITAPGLEVDGRRATIFGMARSGVAAARVLVSHGAAVTVVDEKPAAQLQTVIADVEAAGARAVAGLHEYAELAEPEIIVVSPGVPAAHRLLVQARAAGAYVIGEIELAYRLCTSPIIAVTGTNGKGTVVRLIGGMLQRGGLDAPVVGNIGTPFVSAVDRRHDALVTEISSFQLETIDRFAPWISAILNITPDHRDRHPTMDEYVAAKRRIFENQSADDFTILNIDDPLVAGLRSATPARVLTVSLQSATADARLEGNELVVTPPAGGRAVVCGVDDIPLGGAHNISNALTAALAASVCGVEVEAMAGAIAAQEPAEHLLRDAGAVRGVRFIDDSKATNPAAATADLSAVDGPLVLIAGGDPKGLDLSGFARVAADRAEHIVLIGQSARALAEAIGNPAQVTVAESMEEAVEAAFGVSQPGWTVLLAPACASFGMFRDMSERGEVFCGAVRALADKHGG